MLWFLYALGAAVIWGINYAISGHILEKGMSPRTLFLIDMVFGTLLLALLTTVTGKWQTTALEIKAAQPHLIFLVIAVLASVSAGLLIFMSIEAKNATVASLIEISYPLFTAFFVWAFFRQNTINLATAIGALLIITGVVIVARGKPLTTMIKLTRPLLAACLLAALTLPASAEQYNTPPVRKVTVIGNSSIKVVPDEMNWTISITIKDATIAKAKAAHDASLTATLKYLKSLGDAAKNLQTGGIRIDKQTYFNEGDDKTKPYSCSTQVTFTLTDFDKYGSISDELSKFNGIMVQSVEYASSKAEETRRQALKQALVNAHEKAADLADTAACTINKPLEVLEGGGNSPMPMMRMTAIAAPGGGGTPDAIAGQIEITAQVTATYDLQPK